MRRTLTLGAIAVVALVGIVAGTLALTQGSSSGETGPSRIPVLAYHGVTGDAAPVTDEADPHYFDVRLTEFDRQMAWLHDNGYRSITPAQYVRWLRGDDAGLPAKPVLITFDDGQASTLFATPVLERYGFRAAMYVVSGFADGAFGGPAGERGWYLTWDQLQDMKATGMWVMQFHGGPQGHAYVDDPAQPECHRFYPCTLGQDDAAYHERVKADVAQGLGAMRSAFGLPEGWQGSTFAVPWDDASMGTAAPDEWLGRYFASQFPVVFVQESYTGHEDNQRYRFEVHNPTDLDTFRAGLDSTRFRR